MVSVYLPNHEMLAYWKRGAKEQGTSLSRFIVQHTERSLRNMDEEKLLPRRLLMMQLQEKEKLVDKLELDNRLLKSLAERLDRDLHETRAEAFNPASAPGEHGYDLELVDIIRQQGFVRFDELHEKLGVPVHDVETVKGINNQLDFLEGYGVISKTRLGWRWGK